MDLILADRFEICVLRIVLEKGVHYTAVVDSDSPAVCDRSGAADATPSVLTTGLVILTSEIGAGDGIRSLHLGWSYVVNSLKACSLAERRHLDSYQPKMPVILACNRDLSERALKD